MSTNSFRRRGRNKERSSKVSSPPKHSTQPPRHAISSLADIFSTQLGEISLILSWVFGGCCSNVITFELIISQSSRTGSLITFSQAVFIALQSLPSFIEWRKHAYKPQGLSVFLPHLKKRIVPLSQWALQVCVLTSSSLLNNWALAYDVPLSLHIVFRSSSLPVSMLFGYFVIGRRFSVLQLLSVFSVTIGVLLATLSKPVTSKHVQAESRYWIGIFMLTAALLLTGLLGLLQEKTYRRYGPCWREGLFYTHFLSLPLYLMLWGDIKQGYKALQTSNSQNGTLSVVVLLGLNLITQLACVSGVNSLSARVSSVATNLALTTRKAISLCLSVWLFKHSWNPGLVLGALLVFTGSSLYAAVSMK